MAEVRQRGKNYAEYLSKKMKIRQGLTLIELLVAISIFGVVLISVYSVFHAGLLGFRDIEDNLRTSQVARTVLERLDTELRNSFCFSRDASLFKGTAGGISFLTLVDSYRGEKITHDYAWVSYQAQEDKLMRLCRKNKDSLNSQSTTKAQEFASDVAVVFSYAKLNLDKSLEWQDKWAAITLPVAVKVRLTVKGIADTVFERTIFLPMAR